jgi:hypothetical protein
MQAAMAAMAFSQALLAVQFITQAVVAAAVPTIREADAQAA